jgi:hypothetical protein
MSVSAVAILLSALAFGIILIFIRYLIHKQNMHHINRGGQLEMMVGRQVILEGRLFGYNIPRQNQVTQGPIPPRYEVAVAEDRNLENEANLTHENTQPLSRPPSYESRIFTLQQ